MIIIPAIDLLGGGCVRLYKGDYGTAHGVADDPVEQAKSFEADGAKWLHIVDLDGAKNGETVNREVIGRIAGSVGMKLEVGGGIRDMKTAYGYLEMGVERLIIGSAAVKNPDFLKEALKEFGGAVAVGIDCRDGKVSVSGWTESSDFDYIDFARKMESEGVKNLIFTDISRDGTLTGPNLDMLKKLSVSVDCDITASGGIRDINDIFALSEAGLYAAIAGMSLYSGTLSLKAAVGLTEKG